VANLHKWYTRAIGLFFLAVSVSLALDIMEFGHRPETWHKIFHVGVGLVIVLVGWHRRTFWRPFCLINGAFFLFIALFGVTFPDFGGLDAFNRLDTVLHGIVGTSGLIIGARQ
jgi:hypothetical protein